MVQILEISYESTYIKLEKIRKVGSWIKVLTYGTHWCL